MGSKNSSRSRVLITGAGGFLGHHLANALAGEGVEVTGLLLPDEDDTRLNKEITVIRGDLTHPRSFEDSVRDFDRIYHLAAVLTADEPDMFSRVNVDGTIHLIEACKKNGLQLKRFLFASSISAMGPTGKNQSDENTPCSPINDYGKSKVMAEQYIQSTANPYPWTIVRPVETYGPGRFDSFYQICKAAKMGLQLHLGSGEVTLGYADDIVRGIIQACESPATEGNIYILGGDRTYTLEEVTRVFSKAFRERTISIHLPYALLYMAAFFIEGISRILRSRPVLTRWQLESYLKACYWKFDTRKAREDFGFRPEVDLDQGAKRTVEWYRKEGYL